jgi:excisionase family DNA binding protein
VTAPARLQRNLVLADGVRFLTIAEVALVLRVSKMTVYRLVHAEELAAIRVGRSYRVPDTAVSQYMHCAAVTSSRLEAGPGTEQPGD